VLRGRVISLVMCRVCPCTAAGVMATLHPIYETGSLANGVPTPKQRAGSSFLGTSDLSEQSV